MSDPISSPHFQLLLPDGTPVAVTTAQIDTDYIEYLRQGIGFGAQIGSCVIMFLVLLLLTRPEKRRTPVFIANLLALTFNLGRAIMHCVFLTGPFRMVYPNVTGDYSVIPDWAKHVSISVDTLTLATMIAVEASLILQVQVVCTDITMPRWFRWTSMIFVIFAAIVAIALRFTVSIMNGSTIMKMSVPSLTLQKLADGSSITFTATICIASLFLVMKLRTAIRNQRRFQLSNGLGPMHVVFIMSCQTMIVPAVMAIVHLIPGVYTGMSAHVYNVVVISLPLSTLWATAVTNHRQREMDKNRFNYNESFLTGFPNLPMGQEEKTMRKESASTTNDPFEAALFDGKIPERSSGGLQPVIEPCPENDSEIGPNDGERR